MHNAILAVIAVVLAIAPTLANAHDARPVVVELEQTQSLDVAVRIKVPASVDPAFRPTVELPSDCVPTGEVLAYSAAGAYLRELGFECMHVLSGRSVGIHYPSINPSISTLFKLSLGNGQTLTRLLPPGIDNWLVPEASTWASVARSYVTMGVTHIWKGLDHLLFVSCLLLIARTKRRIVAAITGFTIAHSLTLALSALGYIRLSIGAVEALIALSLVFLAAEIVRQKKNTLTWRQPLVIACAFGLLHGLGFATALSELGLPSLYRVQALAFFNIGVELGQLLFILCVLLLVSLMPPKFRRPKLFGASSKFVIAPVYAAGVVSAYWFFERSMAVMG